MSNKLEELPARLRVSPYTEGVSSSMSEVAQELLDLAREFWKQFYVPTATDALVEFERLYGVTPAAGATTEERRAAITTKMCAAGTANAALIESMAKALTGYDCKVTENFSDYTFSLRFYGTSAGFISIDAALLQSSVAVVAPAHLQFIIEPITWADLESAGLTWEQLEEQFDSWLELESSFFCHLEGESEELT